MTWDLSMYWLLCLCPSTVSYSLCCICHFSFLPSVLQSWDTVQSHYLLFLLLLGIFCFLGYWMESLRSLTLENNLDLNAILMCHILSDPSHCCLYDYYLVSCIELRLDSYLDPSFILLLDFGLHLVICSLIFFFYIKVSVCGFCFQFLNDELDSVCRHFISSLEGSLGMLV